jgi:hypothetical protein
VLTFRQSVLVALAGECGPWFVPNEIAMCRSHARSGLFTLALGALSLVALALWLGSTPAARAAGPIIVNDLGDGSGTCAGSGTGNCTLRDALSFANTNPGAATITFSVSGTITLTSALPAISGMVTIDGGGAITVSGASNIAGLLAVNSGAHASLQALTIANAVWHNGGTQDGGGLYNAGTMTVNMSTFSGNTTCGRGGGLYNSGTMTVTNSLFSRNNVVCPYQNWKYGGTPSFGGGIYNLGTLMVANSTFRSNNAGGEGPFNTGSGGGIQNDGTLTVTDSLFSGNSATALDYGSGGGGIENAGTLAVTNSTFSGNNAVFGGGIHNAGPLTVTNSTLVSNTATLGGGSGILNIAGPRLLQNTLLANSPSGGDCVGLLTADHYNLADDGSCADATVTTNASLHLGPLQDNGGPTWTIALGPGSAAIDAGNNAICPATDQRGFPRLGLCDVGAYEAYIFRLYAPLVLKQP